jgi:hypothetical protein
MTLARIFISLLTFYGAHKRIKGAECPANERDKNYNYRFGRYISVLVP